jgi:probable HAF family extracellular repeat protein
MPAVLAILTILLLLVFPSASSAQWTLEVLGPLEGQPSVGTAINDRRQVVGYSWNSVGTQIPFLWTEKTGYRKFLGEGEGWATDINNRGEIVGVRTPEFNSFLWSEARGYIDLGPGFWPTSINDAGVIAGSCRNDTPEGAGGIGPCIGDNGTRELLPVPFGSAALDLNNAGDAAGYATPPADTEPEMPCVWRHRGGVQMLQIPPGSHHGVAEDVNNAGMVVGWTWMPFDGQRHQVVIWDRKGRIQPGPDHINGIAVAVNNRGTIVGVSPALDNTSGRGFTWTRGGEVVFLPGAEPNWPADINARGDVAGSVYTGAQFYAAVWRYQPATPSDPRNP